MNGVDWPSPAAILPSVESEIKSILAAVGVDVPNFSAGIFFLRNSFPNVHLVVCLFTILLYFCLSFFVYIVITKAQHYYHGITIL